MYCIKEEISINIVNNLLFECCSIIQDETNIAEVDMVEYYKFENLVWQDVQVFLHLSSCVFLLKTFPNRDLPTAEKPSVTFDQIFSFVCQFRVKTKNVIHCSEGAPSMESKHSKTLSVLSNTYTGKN